MYAIVDIAGQQFKVEKGKKIFVNRLEGEKGASLDFSKVLLTDDNGSVKVGRFWCSRKDVARDIRSSMVTASV